MNALYGHRDAGIFGYSHLTGGFAGGQAEYVRVPFGEANLLSIPKDVEDEKAIYLSDILPTSLHAVSYTGVKEGDVVGIWVGLLMYIHINQLTHGVFVGSRSHRSMRYPLGKAKGREAHYCY